MTGEARILYIAGYGRSGSTLVDLILGNHPEIFGAGELTKIFGEVSNENSCSCGRRYEECDIWSKVLSGAGFDRKYAATYDKITRSGEGLTGIWKDEQLYCRIWKTVIQGILRVSGATVIVDSSKTSRKTYRRFWLLKRCGFQVSLIHIVRNPMAVMWSVRRGSNRRLEKGEDAKVVGGMMRGLVSWMISNLTVEAISYRMRTDFLRVRYEDIVAQPIPEIRRIGTLAKIDMTPLLKKFALNGKFISGHGIGGNRMRRKNQISLIDDKEWRELMPLHGRIISKMVRPFAQFYGYTLH